MPRLLIQLGRLWEDVAQMDLTQLQEPRRTY
jgi:hypothetical protein